MRSPWVLPSTSHAGPGQLVLLQNAAADGVVNVVTDVGDAVGPAHAPALQRGRVLRAGVAQNAVPGLLTQVQPCALPFQPFHHAQALLVVAEAAKHPMIQRVFADVPKGRVPQIMPQRDGFGQIFVQPQAPGQRPATCATSSVWVRRVR